MRLKKGVSHSPLQPTMYLAINILNRWFEINDKDFVITSTYDGIHKKGSLHYIGLAIDFRSRDLTELQIDELITYFKQKVLDIRYQFVIEKTHIHLEYDRRVKNETIKT
jgi:hypothetical protein